MTQEHLLNFMKKTLAENPDEVVLLERESPMSLIELFESMNLTAEDLTLDKLNVHSDHSTFQRFDRFNAKYNPFGDSRLREVFLKTDNHLKGKYFARIIKDLGEYQSLELRLSVYGKNNTEWRKLAKWAISNNVYSDNVRWLIQIPRLYNVFKLNKLVKNFQEMLSNIFQPLFEVTNDPGKHPELHKFLQVPALQYLAQYIWHRLALPCLAAVIHFPNILQEAFVYLSVQMPLYIFIAQRNLLWKNSAWLLMSGFPHKVYSPLGIINPIYSGVCHLGPLPLGPVLGVLQRDPTAPHVFPDHVAPSAFGKKPGFPHKLKGHHTHTIVLNIRITFRYETLNNIFKLFKSILFL